jgi:hypothetical protein
MCLTTSQMEPKIAEKPITVYKVLHKEGEGMLVTPYLKKCVWKEILNGEEPLVAEGEKDILTETTVGEGFIHSYGNVSVIKSPFNQNYSVYECEIPEGAEYWVNDGGTEYASEKIVFKNLVFEYVKGDWSEFFKEASAFGKLTDDNYEKVCDFWGHRYKGAYSKKATNGLLSVFQNIAIQYVNEGWENLIDSVNKRYKNNGVKEIIFDEEKLLEYAYSIFAHTNDVNLASDIGKIYKTVQDIYNVAKENHIFSDAMNNNYLSDEIFKVLPEIVIKARDKKRDELMKQAINDYRVTLKKREDEYEDRNELFRYFMMEE